MSGSCGSQHYDCLQNLDTQLQRMLNMDDFDTAQEIRKRRKQIDEVVAEQLVSTSEALTLSICNVEECYAMHLCTLSIYT